MNTIIFRVGSCACFQQRTYTQFRCRAHPQEGNTHFASVPFLRVRYRQCQIGAHVKNEYFYFYIKAYRSS